MATTDLAGCSEATRLWALVDSPDRASGPHAHLTPQTAGSVAGGRHGQWFTSETHRAVRRSARLAARIYPFVRRGDEVEVEMHMDLGFAPNACQTDSLPSRKGVLPLGASGHTPGAPAGVAGVMSELPAWGYEALAWPFEPSVSVDADWGTSMNAIASARARLHGATVSGSLGPSSVRVICGGKPTEIAEGNGRVKGHTFADCAAAFSRGKSLPGDAVQVVAKSKSSETLAFGASVARVQVALEEKRQCVDQSQSQARAYRVKAEWKVKHKIFPWAVILRLEATPLQHTSPDMAKLLADVAAMAGPTSLSGAQQRPWDCRISEWMFRMRSSLAVWRMEIEMTDPCPDQDSVLAAALHFGVLFEALAASHTAHEAVVCMRTHVLSPYFNKGDLLPCTTDWQRAATQAALREFVTAAGGKCEDDNGHIRVARSSRPKDFAQHSSLAHCSVSPKLDGSEAFVVRTWGGTAVVLRDQFFFSVDLKGPPLLVEGELMPPNRLCGSTRLLFVYDTIMAVSAELWNDERPLAIALLPQGWRMGVTTAVCASFAASVAFVRKEGPGAGDEGNSDNNINIEFCRKPFFATPDCPQLAVLECLRYLDQYLTPKGLQCDGLVFARMAGDYFTGEAVKVKVTPTVDAKLGPGPAPGVFELLFRERATAISSARLRGLTRFKETDPPYRECTSLPGLVRLPVPAEVDMVAELAPMKEGPPLLLRLRETLKPPNHVIGAMDIAFSVQHYPSPLTNADSARNRILDPKNWSHWADAYRHGMRKMRWRLFRQLVPPGGIIVDLGAAGGDVGRVARACAPDVLHLVDISADSLERCQKRLAAQSRFAPALATATANSSTPANKASVSSSSPSSLKQQQQQHTELPFHVPVASLAAASAAALPLSPTALAIAVGSGDSNNIVPVPVCKVETHCESLCSETAAWADRAKGCNAILANFVLGQAIRSQQDADKFAVLVEKALGPTGVLVGLIHEHDRLSPMWRGPLFPGLTRSVVCTADADANAGQKKTLAIAAELNGLLRFTVPLEAARTGRIPPWSTVLFEMGWSATAQRASEAAADVTQVLSGFSPSRWHVTAIRADPCRILGAKNPPLGASILAGSVTAFVVRRRVPLFAVLPPRLASVLTVTALTSKSATAASSASCCLLPVGFRSIRVASPHDLGCAALIIALPPGNFLVLIEWPRHGPPKMHLGKDTISVLAPPPPTVPFLCLARWDSTAGITHLWAVVDEKHTWEHNHMRCRELFPAGATVSFTPSADKLLAKHPGQWCALPAHGNAKVLFVVGADADAGVALIRPAAWAALDTWLHSVLKLSPPASFSLDVMTPACGTRTLNGMPVTTVKTEARHALRRYLSGIHQTGVTSHDHHDREGDHDNSNNNNHWQWIWLAPPVHCLPEVATKACAEAARTKAKSADVTTIFVLPFEASKKEEDEFIGTSTGGTDSAGISWLRTPGSVFGIFVVSG